jgi:glutamate-5-semialdehyde dehydrogenase
MDTPQDALDKSRLAQKVLALAPAATRSQVLINLADLLEKDSTLVLAANRKDMSEARLRGLDAARTARLELSGAKLAGLAASLRAVARLPDPLGSGRRWTLPNGMVMNQVRVPLGCLGLIYESRPGVTVEAASLALKSGNAIILKGGREAAHSNGALVALWKQALAASSLPEDAVIGLDSATREPARALMHLKGLDLLIPRGGPELIRTVTEEATVPVIATGVGNCHLYVDESADAAMALNILEDSKMGNPSVCNAVETMLVHRALKEEFLPKAKTRLDRHNVIWHGDAEVLAIISDAMAAGESDWEEEYLGPHLACRIVSGLEEALSHIDRYGTGHSESIVANHAPTGQQFLDRVDAAVVYWNASTRFSDGGEFGFGAEVGISTQKMHARGPMGLEALTTIKTVAMGSGQTRDF